jgi:membrane-associated phospholipid phosphatase
MHKSGEIAERLRTLPGRGESRASASFFDFPTADERWRPVALAGLLFAASAFALGLDRSFAAWGFHKHCPAILGKAFQFSEPFGHGLGVVMIVILIARLDPRRFWAVPRVLLTSLGAGAAADLLKLLVVRVRPRYLVDSLSPGEAFNGWFPLTSAGSHGQSFPSGHMAAAVGLAFALSALYPRGKWLFFALAIFTGCQRLDEGSHFPSDILFGAALGALSAAVCLYRGPLARLFACREAEWVEGARDQRGKGAK